MKFNSDLLKFFLSDHFKGLSKEYILDCVFNNEIQNKWEPNVGDIIVGQTGNIFVISEKVMLSEKLGGTIYFFGGGFCSTNNSGILDSIYCFTANESGKYYHPTKGEIENFNHSCIRDFKFVPYPHEIKIN